MMNEVGAHTRGYNQDSLGICFVGNFDETLPPSEQWSLGVRLVSSLCAILGISKTEVYGHNEFADKSCPGNQFELRLFKSLL